MVSVDNHWASATAVKAPPQPQPAAAAEAQSEPANAKRRAGGGGGGGGVRGGHPSRNTLRKMLDKLGLADAEPIGAQHVMGLVWLLVGWLVG